MTQYKDIPQPTDQRNVSQQDLLNNGRYLLNVSNPASITGIIPVDHAATADNGANPSDGFHKQVSYVNTATAPTSLVNAVNGQSSDSIVYSKSGNLSMLSSQNPGNFKYQLTTLNTTTPVIDFPAFGTNNAYALSTAFVPGIIPAPGGTVISYTGGWTFLPGGLILQYGTINYKPTIGSAQLVPYPVAFTNGIYDFSAIAIEVGASTTFSANTTLSLTTFNLYCSVTSTNKTVKWMAIGK